MRAYSGGTPFGEIAVLNGKLAAACRERLLPRAGETLLPRQAEWLFLPQNCRRIEAGLAPSATRSETPVTSAFRLSPARRPCRWGLAVNLTALLKDELLRREIVPFYRTARAIFFLKT